MIKIIPLLFFFLFLPLIISAQSNSTDTLNAIKKDKKVKKVIIPTITYNNSFKAIFGFMASGFYKLKANDTISPVSSSTLIGTYSTNDTWYVVQANKFYIKEDRFRSKLVGGFGSVNFQTFVDWSDIIGGLPPGIIPTPPPEDGVFVGYNTKFQFVYLDFLARVYKKLYLGAILFIHMR